jgi:hypothetical protein
MSRILFKEDIDKYRDSSNCLPASAKRYITDNNVIDIKKWNRENPEELNNFAASVPVCSSEFYNNEETEGCCYNIADGAECKTTDNYTGLKFLTTAGTKLNLCHKEDVQNLYNTLLDDPNKIILFFKLILVSILTLLVTAIIGTCYEFWLRYGNSIECIYYKSKCANIGKTEKISLVDYMFPNSICYYPYQACFQNKTGQRGGSKSEGIISNFAEYELTGAKCITLDYDTTIYGEKPIPYNVADFVANNNNSEFLLVLAKTISFFFLFPILSARVVLNFIFSKLSTKYQRVIKFNPLLSNIMFLLLSGLIWPIISYLTGSGSYLFGPTFFLAAVISLANLIISMGFVTSLLATIFPKKFLETSLAKCNIPISYYRIFRLKLFYPLSGEISLKIKLFNLFKNLLLLIPIFFLVIIHFTLGANMILIANIYMTLSILFNFLYIPLSNPLECFSILKSHADLLTILFCMGVIGSSASSLDPTTTGIMSGILMLIILYKSFKGMKTSI